MDCNPKNRGLKHVLNKSKYNKNKPKATLPKSNNKSKALESNWDRYGEELTDNYVPLGTDFSLLANAPISKGNHFQFKAEAHKIQNIERTPIDTSGLFNIDLNLIGLSLSTIPFNVRCGMPDDYFSDSQNKIMMHTATNNAKIYNQSLSKEGVNVISNIDSYFSINESIDSPSPSSNENHAILLVECDPKYNQIKHEVDDRPKALENRNLKTSTLNSKIAEVSISDESIYSKDKQGPPLESTSSILETESLQQWLDDVLGD